MPFGAMKTPTYAFGGQGFYSHGHLVMSAGILVITAPLQPSRSLGFETQGSQLWLRHPAYGGLEHFV